MTNFKTLTGKKSERGFTIVELLIVIIVIGILATLVLIAYNNVQTQARDTKRQADAKSLADAATSFKTESTNSSYPTNTSAGFYNDLTNVTGFYPSKTIAIDQSVTNNINATAPSQNAKNNIQAVYCGTSSPLTAANATGMKFIYYIEMKNTTAFTFAGTGC